MIKRGKDHGPGYAKRIFAVSYTVGDSAVCVAITALIHVLRHPRYPGNKVMWVLVVLFIQFIGPALYFALGRGEE